MRRSILPDIKVPSINDVAAFERTGYHVTSYPLLSDEELERARYGVARYYEGERDWPLPISGGFLDWRPDHGGLLRINDYVSLQNKELQDLCGSTIIAKYAAHLIRTSEIRLFHDQLITKLPSNDNSTAIGWHTDQAYWRTCTSKKMITAWIPLVETKEDMGGLSVMEGSHLLGTHDWMRTFNEKDLRTIEAKLAERDIYPKIVQLKVPPGCVSFHHGCTIHGSNPNSGGSPRIAVTVHLQDRDNRYCFRTDEAGRPALHVNDLLCRRDKDGFPDYSDPEVCPILWSDAIDE